MDFRDWIIVVGVIVILGILLDGYRRMRLARMDSLKMSKNMGGEIDTSPLDDDYNPELPGGGARVVARSEPALGDGDEGFESEFSSPNEPSLNDAASASVSTMSQSSDSRHDVPEFELEQEVEDIPWRVKRKEPVVSDSSAEDESGAGAGGLDEPVAAKPSKPSKLATKKADKAEPKPEPKLNTDYEVIVINVDAKPDQIFHGVDIKRLLEACGLEHGDMSIFHRHEEDDLLSPVQFSVANAVEPGYFDPDNMARLSTPGVSFFMSMPGPKDYMQAFDFMLETAQCFAKNLHGELRDERRSVMTKQTIEHCRQRVRDYERKQLSKATH